MKFQGRYSTTERWLHQIAFQTGQAQQALADLEDTMFSDDLQAMSMGRPTFITSLPRSGTTIVLRLLANTPAFASHTYEDMPFLLCPLLWNRYVGYFGQDDEAVERAHGDGIKISTRSPEAFEERIWKYFWPEHYQKNTIQPWGGRESRPEFRRFLRQHMKKIGLLRRQTKNREVRYLAKNNTHIARLHGRPGPLSEGQIIIPFRKPLEQAASALKQHKRFQQIHAEEPFVQKYMEAIGHHEFGAGLKPIHFGSEGLPKSSPEELGFWLQYWVQANEYILKHLQGEDILLPYQQMVEAPENTLARLSTKLSVPSETLTKQAHKLHPPRKHHPDRDNVPEKLLQRSKQLYQQLQQRALTA